VALARCQEVAPTDASVVLIGETGTGKELFARAVHNRSARRDFPFVCVNCAVLPPTLIETELFGHERGAFTGAVSTRQGRFERAHRGTIFLDEIGDLPLEVQAKLLRVLQEGEFERVGSSQSRTIDVRVIAATHHDLEQAVRNGAFRADLYYRLNVYPIALPPLRERTDDIPRLVWYFINRRQRALNRKITRIPAAVLQTLERHAWPGNVRELQNIVERAMIHSDGGTLVLDEFPGPSGALAAGDGETLEAAERRHIENALRRAGWRINGTGNAAERLGLHPNTLRFRMKKLGIRRPPDTGVVRNLERMLA
jgi:formate hydrogenlyase transcriptional activator